MEYTFGGESKMSGSRTGLWEMESLLGYNKKGLPQTNHPYNEGIPLYHRSGDKPLDPTTQALHISRPKKSMAGPAKKRLDNRVSE